jgi:hypothetical protein
MKGFLKKKYLCLMGLGISAITPLEKKRKSALINQSVSQKHLQE